MKQRTEQTIVVRKRNLILIISFLLITGFLVTSFASFFVSRSELRTHLTRNLLPLTSNNIYSEIQRDLMRPIFISSLMANDTFLRDWVINGEKKKSKITRYLKEIRDKYSTFSSFFVSERTRIYYYPEGILKRVKPDEPRDKWYFRARSMKDNYEINVDPDMANRDAMTIFINYKVHDYRGRYIGATGVGLTVSSAKRLIESYQEKYERYVYFLDKKGNIILHGTKFFHEENNIRKSKGLAEYSEKILTSDNTRFNYIKKGKTIHINSRYIPELNWYLIVEQREASITKNITRALLLSLLICIIITGVVLTFTNFTFKKYQGRMEKMATIDKLTGTYNRQALDMILQQAIKDVKRKGVIFSLILFDLDHFKEINDRFGHLAGDEALKSVAGITRKSVRDNDIISRWGGEEFLIILKECRVLEAEGIAEKIRSEIKRGEIIFNDRNIPLTVSLGVCEYRPGEDGDTLLSRVDRALYLAKENGRDRVERGIG